MGALKIRPVSNTDCRLLWEWVNEPQVRAFAFRSEAVSWEEHLDWFHKKLADPDCSIFILTDESGVSMGQVRFDMESEKSTEIAVSISTEQRGCGYGTEAIRLACEQLRRQRPITEVIAYIKPDNLPSIRAFQKAGFADRGKKIVRGQEAVWMTWKVSEVMEIILAALREVKEQMGKKGTFEISPQTRLYGRGSDLDSLGLVQLVIEVEERVGARYGVPITLTDEKALSQENSPFRTVESLTDYVTGFLLEGEASRVS